jgi:hypothetical protein
LSFNEDDNKQVFKFREKVQTLIKSKQTQKVNINKALSNLNKTLHSCLVKIELSHNQNQGSIRSDLVDKAIKEGEALLKILKSLQK